MTRPIDVKQGENKTIIVLTNNDLSGVTEMEFGIDTPEQILKTKSAAQITNITTTQFKVHLVPNDTNTVKPGSYKMQARATFADGKVYNIRFTPNRIKICDSVFVDDYAVNDYN
jgi:hypothetical protein